MEAVAYYFLGGLLAGLVGSFLAAHLLRVDRLWVLSDKPTPDDLHQPIMQAATVYSLTGASGLVGIAARTEHPLLAQALRLVIEGHDEAAIRRKLNARINAVQAFDRRCQFAGRLLGRLAPVLGIAGMAGAMYMGLKQLKDPTGSAAGLAVGVMMLMVGGNLIALFSRRLNKVTPTATAAAQVSGVMITEAAVLIRRGVIPDVVDCTLNSLLGRATQTVHTAKAA